jgi:hypothetical protein
VVLSEESAHLLEQIEKEAEYPGHEQDITKLKQNLVRPDSSVALSSESVDMVRRVVVLTTAMIAALVTLLITITPDPSQASTDTNVIIPSVVVLVTLLFFTFRFTEAFVTDDDEFYESLGAIFR